ncbi:hypothetical protein JCM10512_4753 [Bacteroides reticulotermitis JCM 10512]|uniref:Uncharacterized protein n=1 Tax=Bacteroides reticulotermitis JCM 10512 TaxID=1445607 RepID=W4UZ78_9BACE|nr:hypothetical protein JCM10512_4753 [Bacteroides reticulotermitis JCM 10512]
MQYIDILNDMQKSDNDIRVMYHCAKCLFQASLMKLGTQNSYTNIVQIAKRVKT